MKIKLFDQPFDPWQEIKAFQQSAPAMQGKAGAASVFVGTLRDFNAGDVINSMTLEHYPLMTEKHLAAIVKQAMCNWQLIDVLVAHRVGRVFPSDPIVLIAVWSAHRGDAFAGSRYLIEALKSKVPFWKKELLAAGNERWVEKNSDGYC